ncbi:MAG: hypothetical protein SAK29_00875 [Scytonema sp. PMC 1069.18]|nr:hypothetical protein [Scytonema sp. PMC 1069.18]MEC4881776.1 hypothetical protein [Scytonema sp. PMC 1070.18]
MKKVNSLVIPLPLITEQQQVITRSIEDLEAIANQVASGDRRRRALRTIAHLWDEGVKT